MLKRILTLALLAAFSVSAQAGTSWHKTVAAAQAEAKKNRQLILVDMFADWCGWCHRMEREVFPSAAFQNASKDLVLLRLNTEDRGEGTRLSRQWGVTSLPTFVLITPDLQVAGVIQGYAPADPFSKQVTQTVKAYKDLETLAAKGAKLTPQEKVTLGGKLIERKRYIEAETRLNEVLATKGVPSGTAQQARYQLALSQFEQGRQDVALKQLNSLLSVKPAAKVAEDATFLRARIYVDQGNLKAALTELRSFRQAYPGSSMMPTVDRVLPQIERALGSQ